MPTADGNDQDRLAELFSTLRREPDFDSPDLQAHDATDRLLLTTAADDIRALRAGELAIVGDRHGALTLGAISVFGAVDVRTHQDALLGERALAANASRALGGGLVDEGSTRPWSSHALDASLLSGARVVLVQLPRSLDALDEIGAAIATHAAPDVRVYAGGRIKHMTTRMNEVLGRSFASVTAGLAQRKSRVLTAKDPRPARTRLFPVWGEDADVPFRLAAFGQTFGGATLDHGSRLLLSTLAGGWPDADRIVDLGCGNGVLAVAAALARPRAQVIATDQSSAAVLATALTADAAGVASRVRVHRADAAEAVPDGWAEVILLNPPFHTGAVVHIGVAHRLIASCARALAPGGELRVVFNSTLRYRSFLARTIGPVRELARDRTFTVLSATRGLPD